MPYTTPAARWQALTHRDRAANNHFVYTVRSTLIYCRPHCPARLARRANIGFCDTPAEAEKLGFRACKRCKPDVGDVEDETDRAVRVAKEVLGEVAVAQRRGGGKGGAMGEGMGVKELAKRVGLSERYFYGVFKAKVGCSPKEYLSRLLSEEQTIPEPEDKLPDIRHLPGVPGTQTVDSSTSLADYCVFEQPHSFDDLLYWDTPPANALTSPETESPPLPSIPTTPDDSSNRVSANSSVATGGNSLRPSTSLPNLQNWTCNTAIFPDDDFDFSEILKDPLPGLDVGLWDNESIDLSLFTTADCGRDMYSADFDVWEALNLKLA
ncbi:hypothetical protein K402DRAFT_390345 [Aulographum hederae CBS 113979]|uniref:HTH araC/xylS-type domain-containing protein n=1 Tax=Aulographum hederae CBS 113979 TaxID=1176131 RepID=A0A6G1HAE3_9PEZI|nr:hypothetical protein K402DRAFT_390345 [Aulographum hederae CBS 113979]